MLSKLFAATLQPYAWRLSFEDSQNLRCSFKRSDVHGTGVLERSTVLKCLAEVIQEVYSTSFCFPFEDYFAVWEIAPRLFILTFKRIVPKISLVNTLAFFRPWCTIF